MREERATVVLVTNSVSILSGCDVLYCMEGGHVVRKETLVQGDGDSSNSGTTPSPATRPPLVKESASSVTNDGERNQILPGTSGSNGDATATTITTLVADEGREQGSVKWEIYKTYARSVSFIVSALTLLSLLGMQLSANAFTYWLSLWCGSTVVVSIHSFLVVSGIIAGINTVFTIARSFLFAYGGGWKGINVKVAW